MNYVGLDYHTKYAVATKMNKFGKVLSEDRIENTKEDIRDYFSDLDPGSKVVLEATNNWYCFVEWTHDLPINTILAHPTKTKAIASARIKTDSIDSKILADLLRSNFIAESYLAPQGVRDVRELVRYRTTLVRLRTQFKVRIRSVLFKVGEEIKAKEITSKKAREEVEKLDLRSIYKDEIKSCLAMADIVTRQIETFEEKIVKEANMCEDTLLLMSIPGISFFSALLITSEIGDYKRFSSSRKLTSWAGLVPSTYSSGGKTRRGRITKTGSKNLRFVLLQAVPHVIKKSPKLFSLYQRVSKKHGARVARIAVSRKLLAIILVMLKTRTSFQPNRLSASNISSHLS